MALHGYPRYAKDMEIWIECSQDNAEKMMTALKAFGFGSIGLENEDLLEKDQIIQLGYPPHRLDLLTGLKDVDFESCYQSRVCVDIHGVLIDFIDIDNYKPSQKSL